MIHCRSIALIALAIVTISQPTYACRSIAHFEIEDIRYADVVVVGQVSNYRIIRDLEFRRKMLANPNLSPELSSTL